MNAPVAATDPLFTYRRLGFRWTLYANRIEVERRTGIVQRKEALLLRNVSDVRIAGLTRTLTVVTNDGRTHAWQLGLQSEAARDAILNALPA